MKKAIRFAIVVCLVSWVYVAVFYFGFGVHNTTDKPMLFTGMAAIYMLFPMLCAMFMQRFVDKVPLKSTGLLNFKINWYWLVAWLLPLLLVAICILVNGLIPGVQWHYGPEQMLSQLGLSGEQQEAVLKQFSSISMPVMLLISVFEGLLAGATLNALFAFGEEYGWRNYLVDAIRNKKFVTAALFIGIVWGIWHAPIILMGYNYPQHPQIGVLMMVLMCVLLCPIELYLVLKCKTVIVAAIFHGTFNALAGTVGLCILGGNDLTNGMLGLAGFIAMALCILLLFLFDRHVTKDNIFTKTIGESLEEIQEETSHD